MAKFHSKPFEIEATQWHKMGDHPAVKLGAQIGDAAPFDTFWVKSMQGMVQVEPGDWIINEPDGRLHYPCNPEVFAAKYEPAGEPIEEGSVEH